MEKRILASPKCLGRQIAYLTELARVSQHRNFGCLLWPGFLPVISSFTHRRKKSSVLTYLLNEAHNSVFLCTLFLIRHIIYSQISQLNAALSLWKGLQNFIWIQASSCVLCPVWLLKSQCAPFYVWSRFIPAYTEKAFSVIGSEEYHLEHLLRPHSWGTPVITCYSLSPLLWNTRSIFVCVLKLMIDESYSKLLLWRANPQAPTHFHASMPKWDYILEPNCD